MPSRRRSELTPVGYHDLLRDLRHPGCPACRAADRAARKRIDSILWEYVNDPDVRGALVTSHGFCARHARVALEVAREQAAGLGMAIIYEHLLRHCRAHVERYRDEGTRGGWLSRPGDPADILDVGDCPACQAARFVAESYLDVAADSAPDSEVTEALARDGRGFCLPHLVLGLSRASERERVERLARIFLDTSERLESELRTYIDKHDYRRVDEPKGSESDSWVRALGWIVGFEALGSRWVR